MVLLSGGLACADLNLYLSDLNVSARSDFNGFRAELGVHFGASEPQLDLVFRSVHAPGDAVLCLWLGRHSRQPLDVVLRHYRSHKGQGWGAFAQSLGIKPGSPEFKMLKAGDLGWHYSGKGKHDGKSRHDEDHDHGKGHDKDKHG
jgi:hypothetical protein